MNLTQLLDEISKLDNATFVELTNQLSAQRQKRAQEIQAAAEQQIAVLTGGEAKTKGKRRPAAAKYVHPQSGQTWTGQGRQPKWVSEYLEKGGNEEDLKIK